jgi:putative oxidoreductase
MTTLTQMWNLGRNESARRSRVTVGVLWTLQIFSAAVFLFAGVQKLSGAPDMVQAFATIGIGQWFRYLTATIELVAGALLLIPAVASYGAAALAVTMVGAIITHLFILGGSPIVPILLLASTTTIAWARRSDR